MRSDKVIRGEEESGLVMMRKNERKKLIIVMNAHYNSLTVQESEKTITHEYCLLKRSRRTGELCGAGAGAGSGI